MERAPPRFGIVVVGAGILGCALAHHLSARGARSVLLYDRDHPAAGASGWGAGIVSASCWNPWDVRLVQESQAQYRRIWEEWGTGAYHVNGGIRTVATPEAARRLEVRAHELRQSGVKVRWLEAEELQRLVPAGAFSDVTGALHTPDDAVVAPAELTFAFAELAAHAGVEVTWGHGDPRVRREGGRWRLETLGGTYHADQLVVSCGAWTKRVLEGLGLPLPLAPYRTQACRLRPPAAAPRFPSLHDTELDVYLRPFAGGRVLAGDGTETTECDPERAKRSADFSFLEHVASSFRRRYPGWAEAAVERSWAGVCASTPDRYPIVGPVPDAEELYVAAGFNGFGIMRAGAIAERLSEGILHGRWGSLAPADPGRFPDRALRFDPRPGATL